LVSALFANALKNIVSYENVDEKALLKEHTSLRVGGRACVALIDDINSFIEVVKLCALYETDYYFLGGGSNILASDKGYDGVVLAFSKKTAYIKRLDNFIVAGAGASVTSLAKYCLKNNLSGLEFLTGIPAKTGGAVAMNAGAYSQSMGESLLSVKTVINGKEFVVLNKDSAFSYRSSLFLENKLPVFEAVFALKPCTEQEAQAHVEYMFNKRKSSQPLGTANCGSVFKAHSGAPAALFIEEAGLKGFHIGDAEVSLKHCNVIINKGGATASQIYKLINYMKERVLSKCGVPLEEEVRYLGEF
jgi:UDP-N-acetylmuramate dehydrogenase